MDGKELMKQTLDQIPQANSNAKRVVGLVKEGGRITGYQLSDNSIVEKQQAAASFQKAFIENDYQEDDEIKIVRTKKFDIKPMYAEDACIQMELLGHNFYVFCNAETEQVNVVYKRKGGTYGLIEPED